MKPKPKLSIIVITKNEDKTIGKCLSSLQKIKENKEIILIDSNSIDKTRDIAAKHNIKVVNIEKSNVYSAPAGRNIGLKFARGKYILFVDGDQIVNPRWVEKHLVFLEQNNFDAVFGQYIHLRPEQEFKGFIGLDSKFKVKSAKKLMGTCIIRNSELLQKENFDPFMKGEEERDLAYRLIRKGYSLFESKEIMAAHFLKKEDFKEVEEKINFCVGIGQIIKKYLLSEFFLNVLFDFRKYWVIPLLSIATLISFILRANPLISFALLIISIFTIFLKNKYQLNSHFFVIFIKGIMFPIKVLQGVILEFRHKPQFNYKLKVLK